MLDFHHKKLASWLSESHLVAEQIKVYRNALEQTSSQSVVIDDFLRVDQFTALAEGFANDLEYEDQYKLTGGGGRVDGVAWNNANEDSRFYRHGESFHAKPGHEMSKGYLRHLKFRQFLQSPPMAAYFGELVGASLCLHGLNAKRLIGDQGHALDWHADSGYNRALCAVPYMNTEWPDEAGGRFQWREADGHVWSLSPSPNRLVLFRPDSGQEHRIEPLIGDRPRYNYSFWYENAA